MIWIRSCSHQVLGKKPELPDGTPVATGCIGTASPFHSRTSKRSLCHPEMLPVWVNQEALQGGFTISVPLVETFEPLLADRTRLLQRCQRGERGVPKDADTDLSAWAKTTVQSCIMLDRFPCPRSLSGTHQLSPKGYLHVVSRTRSLTIDETECHDMRQISHPWVRQRRIRLCRQSEPVPRESVIPSSDWLPVLRTHLPAAEVMIVKKIADLRNDHHEITGLMRFTMQAGYEPQAKLWGIGKTAYSIVQGDNIMSEALLYGLKNPRPG